MALLTGSVKEGAFKSCTGKHCSVDRCAREIGSAKVGTGEVAGLDVRFDERRAAQVRALKVCDEEDSAEVDSFKVHVPEIVAGLAKVLCLEVSFASFEALPKCVFSLVHWLFRNASALGRTGLRGLTPC
jgi:hypothetical protein